MDVRCEKCQTEYELDESRLKPSGVTVKCTNCGHMFKIRRRASTNVGMPTVPAPPAASAPASTTSVTAVGRPGDSDSPLRVTDPGSGPTQERQWMVRLDNGETRTCRELASLQQWIVAGIVSRESLISRSGKTWKRLGDIPELGQYFVIAEEARGKRSQTPSKPAAGTILGVGTAADDLPTGHYPAAPSDRAVTPQITRAATPTPAPPARPPTGPVKASPTAQTELATGPIPGGAAPRRPPTQPPPVPKKPDAGRSTAAWASAEIKASQSMAEMPQGPRSGKLAAIPDEPAFAGRVRLAPSDDQGFQSGKLPITEEDDDLPLERRRGSRAGTYLAIFALLVIGGAAGVVYLTLFRNQRGAAPAKHDAGVVAQVASDAPAAKPAPAPDAAVAAKPSDPLATARAELLADVGARLDQAAQQLADKTDPAALALRARLLAAHAQNLEDSAGLVEHAQAGALRKQVKQLAIEAAPLAQRALKAAPADAAANLAMADVLRLQGKPAREVERFLDTAKAKAGSDAELARSVALGEGELALRDGKLDVAQKALAAVDAPDDMRGKLALALVAFAQNRAADAKPLVDQILATQPDQEVAKQLSAKLETLVASTDPMPTEDHGGGHPNAGTSHPALPVAADYDSLRKRADQLAQTNCTAAKDLYRRALEQKPNGVEAMTGMAYCELDAKDFASAYREFSTALVVQTNYEPALAGIAETYQQQGNKAKAIEAWHKYLGVYPGAMKAKRQLELLGEGDSSSSGAGSASTGGATGGSAAGGGDAPGSAAAPAPTPTPAPAPATSGDLGSPAPPAGSDH